MSIRSVRSPLAVTGGRHAAEIGQVTAAFQTLQTDSIFHLTGCCDQLRQQQQSNEGRSLFCLQDRLNRDLQLS
jgi:hypothetical protein